MTAKATERFNLRATPDQAAMIRTAADLGNERSVTDYILGCATMVAEQRLMARSEFRLSASQYRQFVEALDRPVQEKPRLRRLMREPSILEVGE